MRLVLLMSVLLSNAVQAQSLFAPTPLYDAQKHQNIALILPKSAPTPQGGLVFKALLKGDIRLFEDKNSFAVLVNLRGTVPQTHATCEANLTLTPHKMTYTGKQHGVPRYHSKLLGCDIFIDRLDDAVVMRGGKCVTTTGCEIDASGLFGDFSLAKNDTQIEKERTIYETRMNAARKTLMKAYKRTPHLNNFISEQLDFNAQRASLCQGYSQANLSYCGMKLTQARALELEARLSPAR